VRGRGSLLPFSTLFGRKQSVNRDTIHYDKKTAGVIKNVRERGSLLPFSTLFGRKQSVNRDTIHYDKKTAGIIKNVRERGSLLPFSTVNGDAIHYGKKAAGDIKNAKDKADVIIKGVKENGISGAWESIKERKTAFEKARENAKEGGLQKDFNININGTLKLTGENGQSVDIIGELRKNPQLLRSLADMISKEISYLDKGTNVVQKG
jgi:hypothetical protein